MRLITKDKILEFLNRDVDYTLLVLDKGGDNDQLIVDGTVSLQAFADFINDYCSGVPNSSTKEVFHEPEPAHEHEHGGEAGGA